MDELIARWESYYVATAGAAAVLLGLVYVGLSLHIERDQAQRFRGLAIQSAVSLLYALLASLVMLVPEGRPLSQAVLLGVVALFGMWASLSALVDARRGHPSPLAVGFRFILPLAVMLTLLVAAIALAANWRAGVWLVGAVVFLHIVLGSQNAWDLFLGAGSAPTPPGQDTTAG